MMRCTVAILPMILLTPPIGEPTGSDVRPEVAVAIKRLQSSRQTERGLALLRLRKAGKDARPAWPLLVDSLDNSGASSHERLQVLHVLGNIADPEDEAMSRAVVLAVLHDLASGDAPEPLRNYMILCQHERQLRHFVPRLRTMLRFRDPHGKDGDTGGFIFDLLARSGMEGFQALVEVASDRRARYRALAVSRLGDFGESARPALPLLRDRLGDPSDAVRFQAAVALLRLDRPGCLGVAVPTLACLVESNTKSAREALQALRDLGPDAAESVPALTKALRRPESWREAVAALQAIGPAAADAAADLRELLDRSEDRFVVEIAHALWCVAPSGDRAALNVLFDRAEHGDERQDAIRALGQLGRGVPGVWEALRRLRGQVDKADASTLALALWRTAPREQNAAQQWDGRDEAIDDLDDLLKHHDSRAFAIVCIIGPGASQLVPRLRAMLSGAGEISTFGAAILLGEIGSPARSAVPRLWELANDAKQPPDIRAEAALAVARIDATRAEPAISVFCRTSNFENTRDITRLAAFGPRARSAVPRLREALASVKPDLRHAAADALWRIDPDEARRLGVIRPAPRLGEEIRP